MILKYSELIFEKEMTSIVIGKNNVFEYKKIIENVEAEGRARLDQHLQVSDSNWVHVWNKVSKNIDNEYIGDIRWHEL
jgi:hypothetical protein